MRLFWKVFAVLWLATLLVGGSGFLVSRALQQDWLLLQLNPQLRDFAAQLTTEYEQRGAVAAQTMCGHGYSTPTDKACYPAPCRACRT